MLYLHFHIISCKGVDKGGGGPDVIGELLTFTAYVHVYCTCIYLIFKRARIYAKDACIAIVTKCKIDSVFHML